MNNENKLKKWEISLLIALCVTMLTGTWAQAGEAELSSNLIRLHVIAVSDKDNEQAIKLRVRDGVLAYLTPRLSGTESAGDALAVISSELDGIKAAAESAAEGRNVKVTLSDEYYPTREYAGFSLPAGKYRSLRVILGEGQGHNWWCVVFPPLCVSAAGAQRAKEAMSEGDYRVITESGGYAVKFRILELWGELMSKLG